MNRKPLKGWMKHFDFILIDIVALQISFVLAFFINIGFRNPYEFSSYFYLIEILTISQFILFFFIGSHKGIIRRKSYEELMNVFIFTILMFLIAITLFFIFHTTFLISRLQTAYTCILYIGIDFLLRQLNKYRLFKKVIDKRSLKRSLILVTSGKLVDLAMEKLTDPNVYREYFISFIVVNDDDMKNIKNSYNIPILNLLTEDVINKIRINWVDEVFIFQPNNYSINKGFINDLIDMGLTVHMSPEILNSEDWPSVEMRKLGKFKVLTSCIKFTPTNQLILKRLLDIFGGIIGCIITGILYLFVAPLIKKEDKGSAFFKQTRIGRNGREFKMYKFRSMYNDAEAKKEELLKENKIKDGLMFKIDNDTRILGSYKLDKNGKPKGIGNFIRKTSIDEFPQFFNVLKGDMSIVGTRPPLPEEWEKYNNHHRARMTVRPGITGLWQISGRSEITDFEEVVKLDMEYIENWSLIQDIIIILKTIKVVILGKGAV